MPKGYLTEESVEDLALDELEKLGYSVFKSESYISPNKQIDAARGKDHTVAILLTNLDKALRRLNPGYEDEIYKEAVRNFIRLADNPKMLIDCAKY